jgi:hypothetical protein
MRGLMNGDGEEEDEQADEERDDVHFKSDVFIAYRPDEVKRDKFGMDLLPFRFLTP